LNRRAHLVVSQSPPPTSMRGNSLGIDVEIEWNLGIAPGFPEVQDRIHFAANLDVKTGRRLKRYLQSATRFFNCFRKFWSVESIPKHPGFKCGGCLDPGRTVA